MTSQELIRAFSWAVLLVPLLLVSGRSPAAQGCAINWRKAVPCPAFSPLTVNDMAYDGHTFVGVGNGGYIVTSTDGVTWTQRMSHFDVDLTTVAAANGWFVASGMAMPPGGSLTLVSRDGIDWSVRWGSGAWDLASAGDLFFAGQQTSPDGSLWTPFYLPRDDSFDNFVSYGNGLWLKIQPNGGSPAVVYTSTDGHDWHLMPVPPFSQVASIAFGGNRFLVLSDAPYSSKDGRSWKKAAGPTWTVPMVYANGQFTVVSKPDTWFSKNGKKWSKSTSDLPSLTRLYWLFWTGSAYIGIGDLGTMAQDVFESQDGIHWTVRPFCGGANNGAGQVRFFDEAGLFVAAGNLWTSRDGLHWTEPLTGGSASAVSYGDGTFVAVGAHGTALWSHDGRSWTQVATGFTEDLYDVTYGEGLFVAVGQSGRVITSPDGQTWTSSPSYFFSTLQSIVFAQGTFVAVGYGSSTGIASSDGLVWQGVELGLDLRSVPGPTASYAMGHFIVAAPDGLTISEDGRVWTYVGSPSVVGNVVEWNGQAYAPGYGGGELTSSDLLTWSDVVTNGPDRVVQGYSLATDGSVLVLSGGEVVVGTCAPYVNTVTPDRTPGGASSTLTLEGTGFSNVTRVRFGGTPATSFTVLSDSRIEAVAPPLSPDRIAVTADADDEPGVVSLQDDLKAGGEPLVFGACPSVLSVNPTYYWQVDFWGKGLSEVTDVTVPGGYVGGAWASGEDGAIYWIWPTTAGASAASVTFRDGSSMPVPGGMTFVEPPVITEVKVIRNPFAIKIIGTGFTDDLVAELNNTLMPAKFKSTTRMSLKGNGLVPLLQPGTNYLQLKSCSGAVSSNIATFAP